MILWYKTYYDIKRNVDTVFHKIHLIAQVINACLNLLTSVSLVDCRFMSSLPLSKLRMPSIQCHCPLMSVRMCVFMCVCRTSPWKALVAPLCQHALQRSVRSRLSRWRLFSARFPVAWDDFQFGLLLQYPSMLLAHQKPSIMILPVD